MRPQRPSRKTLQNGFTLVEVMLAVLVLGVGILAVSNLQGNLIRSGAEANERSVASNLVGKKIDDLRQFIQLTTSDATVPDTWSTAISNPNSVAFNHIADNAGGLMGSGAYTIGNINFDLTWDVQNYYFAGTDVKATTTPSGAEYPSYKTAHVVAKWDSVSSTNNVVSFDTVINAYNPLYTTLSGSLPVGNAGPTIPYTPQTAPDVVPVTIDGGGTKKETSKPEPDLSKKGESTKVQFETVTYSQNLDTVKREEFRTLVCKCKNAGSPNSTQEVYGLTTWDDTLQKIVDVTEIQNKTITLTDVDNSGGEDQDNDCAICCRDGDDVVSSVYKVCRMKRVDGILRMFQPWKLIGFNLIPATYFNDNSGISQMTTTLQAANISKYSDYVTTLVRSVLVANGTEPAYNSYTTVDTSFINNTSTYTNIKGATTIDHLAFTSGDSPRQFQARAIYLDYPPTGIYTQIVGQTTFYTPATVPLDRIPFYEVNLTRLAGWIPDKNVGNNGATTGDTSFVVHYTSQHDTISNSPGCASSNITTRNYVTNDIIKNGCEQVYSRGEFDPNVVATTTVTTRIFTNSDGVIDRNVNPGNVNADSEAGLTVSP